MHGNKTELCMKNSKGINIIYTTKLKGKQTYRHRSRRAKRCLPSADEESVANITNNTLTIPWLFIQSHTTRHKHYDARVDARARVACKDVSGPQWAHDWQLAHCWPVLCRAAHRATNFRQGIAPCRVNDMGSARDDMINGFLMGSTI